MSKTLRLLIVEDSEDDARLLLRTLQNGGYAVEAFRAETEDEMRTALNEQLWDLVICDYSLPQFSAPRALQLLRSTDQDLPFIIISGTIGEETAVAALKAGAHDFIIKGNFSRLVPAIERELADAQARRERRQALTALKDSEERYRSLFESNPHPMWVYDIETLKFLAVNHSAVHHYGYSHEEFLGMALKDIRPDEDIPALLANLEKEHGAHQESGAWRHRKKDGTLINVEITSHFVQWAERPARLVLANDVTKRLQAESALREAELKYRTLVEHIPAIIYIAEPVVTGKTLYVSPQVDILGYTPEEWLTDDFWVTILHPDDRERVVDSYRRGREPGGVFNADYRLIARDGRIVWIHDEGVFVRNESGDPLYIQGVMIDITTRKVAEEALILSEKRFRNLFENTPVSVWEEDFSVAKAYLDNLNGASDGDLAIFLAENPDVVETCANLVKVIDVNQASLDLHGASDKSELLSNLNALFTPEMYQVFRQELIALQTDQPFLRAESVMRTLQGKRRDVIVSWVPMPGYEGTYSRVLVSSVDVTESKQRERELEAIVAVNKSLRLPQTLDETLERVLDEALNLIQADAGSIWLYDRVTEQVRQILQRGWGEVNNLEFARGQSIPGMVVENGEAIISKEFRTDPRVDESRRPHIPEGVGGVCVPLRGSDHIVGVLFVNTRAPRELTMDELRVIHAVAEIGGNAIQRMELLEQTRLQLDRLAALREIDLAISSSIDMRVTLKTVLEQVLKELKVDAADVLLFNQAFGHLEYVTGRGFRSSAVLSTDLSLSNSFAGKAVLEREIVHIRDLRQAGEKFSRSNLLADENFVSYFAVPLIAKGEVKGVLEIFHRSVLHPDLEWFDFLDSLGWQTAVAVDNSLLFESLQRSNADLRLAYDTTIEGWSRALDLRDKETEGHTQRVTEMTLKLARAIGMREEHLVHVRRGALLHDIGKMGVPDNILLKPAKLTEDEWVIMRRHPQFAYDMLKPILYLRDALEIPFCHHEKWDGTGYPRGLKGEEIPLAARLFAVVDVWDALTSDRPYRPAWPKERALAHIREQSGTHLDPQVVEVFNRTFGFDSLAADLEKG